MKKIIILQCVMLVSIWSSYSRGDTADRLKEVVKKSGLNSSDLSLSIINHDGEKVFDLNADKKLIPASITKLITSAAVMVELTPQYQFHTQLLTDSDEKDGELKGNLYLKGLGDPAFVSEKMWMMVNDFTRSGIKVISGDLIADDSYFDSERVDLGRESERNDRAYDAPVGALSFNWNSTTIYVRPGKKAGDPAKVWIDPENEFVVLKGNIKTSSGDTDLRSSRETVKDKDVITVAGQIALGSGEKHIYKNISNPPLYAAANLKEFLKQRGIKITGEIKTGKTPSRAKILVDFKGEPLSRSIEGMNKFSNNFIAEMLVKNLSAVKTKDVGRMASGLEEVKKFLTERLKWSSKDFTLVNVSGFTRKNQFSATQFTDLLKWIYKQFKIYPEYLQSLPIAGIDGTLEKRMKGAPTENWVRAKTGSINNVVTLSGYAGKPSGETYALAFIYNGSADEGRVRDIFDRLVVSLLK